jgi:pyruvate/2-oxoglutarate dehydrogenase complex dihydrolipoamide acyltransferase (E2) component
MGSRAIIFALGNIAPKPVVVGGEVVVRDILHLTVQVNHDVVDGASSARFTQRLVRNIQEAGKA